MSRKQVGQCSGALTLEVTEAGLKQLGHVGVPAPLGLQVRTVLGAQLQVGQLQAERLAPDGPLAGGAAEGRGAEVRDGEAELQDRVRGKHREGGADLKVLRLE